MDIETEEALLSTLDRLALSADDHAAMLRSAATSLKRGAAAFARISNLTYAQFAQRLIDDRTLRAREFDPELLGEPAWDILLDLFVAQERQQRITITSLGIAAAVPATTALRWIAALVEKGALEREPDHQDKRKVYVKLSASADQSLRAYLARAARAWSITLR